MRNEIVKWSIQFPLDRWWRDKYNTPYKSFQHLEVSQIDILFEWFEEKVFLEIRRKSELLVEKCSLLENGEFLTRRSQESIINESKLFDELNLEDLDEIE